MARPEAKASERIKPLNDPERNFIVQQGCGIRLGPAPAPRRFAQGMACIFALVIGLLLKMNWLLPQG
jgi:hypothetical protein